MNTPNFMPGEIQNRSIGEQFLAGETIRWVGQEPKSRYVTNRVVRIIALSFIVLVSGLIGGFMLIMNPNIFRGSLQSLLPFLVPTAIFGFSIYNLARGIQELVKGLPAMYVVTDQHAMIVERGSKPQIKTYGAEAINTMQVTRKKNGTGNIVFERVVSWGRDSEGRSQRQVVEIGFFGLESVDEVCRHLRQIIPPGPVAQIGGGPLLSSNPAIAPENPNFFFALVSSALHESLYKIFVASGHVTGARIAGSFSSTGLRHMGDVSGYGFLFHPFAKILAGQEQKREARYQGLNPLNPELLAADKANFHYTSLEIASVSISEEYKTLDSGYNTSGRLEIHLREGKTRKFWLTRNANPAAVAEIFRANGVLVEAQVGHPSHA